MDLFEVIGPVMIGPSSSHTAGAARIGRVTRRLLGETPVKADIGFHGSFAKTYVGHGTDRAVVGGLMDMGVDDERLRGSLKLAKEAGLAVEFHPIRLKNAHPNTMVIDAYGLHNHVTVRAASVGGGSIRVETLDGLEVGFSGENTTLVVQHRDEPGVIAAVSLKLAQAGLNIATMRVFRTVAGGEAVMALELDENPGQDVLSSLQTLGGVRKAILLDRI